MVQKSGEKKPHEGLREVGKFLGVFAVIGIVSWTASEFRMPPDEEMLPQRELACDSPIRETRAKFGSTVLEIVEQKVQFGPGVTAIDILNSGNVEGLSISTGGSSTYTLESAGILSDDILVRTPATCYWTKVQ